MKMKEHFAVNPDRLAWCLHDFKLDATGLALSCHISEDKINKALGGQEVFTFKQLEKVADFFGRGVLFFIDPNPVIEGRIHSPQFRTIQNKSPDLTPELRKLIEKAEWQREVYLGILEETGELNEFPEKLPRYDGYSASKAGSRAREWLNISGAQDINTYREALAKKGLLVFRAQGYAGDWHWGKESPVLGFSLYFEQFPVIVLRKAEWKTRQAFTLMHELGHLILHRSGSIDGDEDFRSRERKETEANQFAGNLLIPGEYLERINESKHPKNVEDLEHWVSGVSKECGVSADVVFIRLIDAGRLSQTEYDDYRAWRAKTPVPPAPKGGSREYRHREPIHIFGDRYVRTILGALNERLITLPKASSYLDNIKIKDIHDLERHYAHI